MFDECYDTGHDIPTLPRCTPTYQLAYHVLPPSQYRTRFGHPHLPYCPVIYIVDAKLPLGNVSQLIGMVIQLLPTTLFAQSHSE